MKKWKMTKKDKRLLVGAVLLVLFTLGQWLFSPPKEDIAHAVDVTEVPAYSGQPYAVINGGKPLFDEADLVTDCYEHYGELDELGRCTVTIACVGLDTMPTEERGSISSVKPTGWVQGYYDFVDGGVLYNRCHLIGFQLTGENANRGNLITGTHYMNVEGMLPFEDEVANYIRRTGNHVIYRVTPIFQGDELVARGVQMEAYSVEDQGTGVCFHVYVYNVQPGVYIDYTTGENKTAPRESGAVYCFSASTLEGGIPYIFR